MFKNSQTYFKNLTVWKQQDIYSTFGLFHHYAWKNSDKQTIIAEESFEGKYFLCYLEPPDRNLKSFPFYITTAYFDVERKWFKIKKTG